MDSPFLRQAFVAVSTQLAAMSMGGSIGIPCVFLQQFKSNESTIRPDLSTSTWIISTYGIAGIPSIFMPSIMQLRGRKISFITSCLFLIIGWLLMYAANSSVTLIVAQAFLGLGSYSVIVVNLMTVSEMIGPKYRTIIMMMLGVNQTIGMSVVTVIGNVLHWKTIALIMCFPGIGALFMVSMWPESPSWLAYKGNFDECEKAFKRLRGIDDESMKELQSLITAQRENRRTIPKSFTVKESLSKLREKDFYLPNFYMFLILSYFYLSGGLCLYIYAQQVMESATGNPTAALYGYLYRDASLVIGSCVALVFVKYFNSKSVLLATSSGSIFSLLCCFIITFLQYKGILSKDSLLLIYSFAAYTSFCNSGFNFLTFSLSSELMPVKHRGLGGALFVISTCSFHALSGKVYPYLVLYLNLWGTFLLFTIVGIVGEFLVWRLIPETKNRTLQEIEDYYNYGSFVKQDYINNVSICESIITEKELK